MYQVRLLVELETGVMTTLKDKAAVKKMSATNTRSLNRMKLQLKKHNKAYEAEMTACQNNPGLYTTEDEDESDSDVDSDDSSDIDSDASTAGSPSSSFDRKGESSSSEDSDASDYDDSDVKKKKPSKVRVSCILMCCCISLLLVVYIAVSPVPPLTLAMMTSFDSLLVNAFLVSESRRDAISPTMR